MSELQFFSQISRPKSFWKIFQISDFEQGILEKSYNSDLESQIIFGHNN